MLFWSSNTLRIESKNALHYWALDCCVLRNRFTILSPVQPLTKNPFVHYASSGYHSTMNMISTKYINQTNVMTLSFFSSIWSLLRKSVAKDHGGSEICCQVHTHKVLNTHGNWNILLVGINHLTLSNALAWTTAPFRGGREVQSFMLHDVPDISQQIKENELFPDRLMPKHYWNPSTLLLFRQQPKTMYCLS